MNYNDYVELLDAILIEIESQRNELRKSDLNEDEINVLKENIEILNIEGFKLYSEAYGNLNFIERKLFTQKFKEVTKSTIKFNKEIEIKITFNEDEIISEPNLAKVWTYIKSLSGNKQNIIYSTLKKVKLIQDSELTKFEKSNEIKKILWTSQSIRNKILIGGLIGTIFGFLVFGTGGIGIAGLGSAFGIWGFLSGTLGGILVSSLIANFEKK